MKMYKLGLYFFLETLSEGFVKKLSPLEVYIELYKGKTREVW